MCENSVVTTSSSQGKLSEENTELGEGPQDLCGNQCFVSSFHRSGKEVHLTVIFHQRNPLHFPDQKIRKMENTFASSVQKCLGCSEHGLPIHIASLALPNTSYTYMYLSFGFHAVLFSSFLSA